MNKVILIGRLTKDAEFKTIDEIGKNVLNFIIAINRNYVNDKNEVETDYIPVSYWRKSGDSLQNYLLKGRLVCVTGKIIIKSYELQDGTKKYITVINAEEIQFLDNKKSKEIV